jgi:NADPH:quinone reductase
MGYKYVALDEFGGPDVLTVREESTLPEPGPGEVRIRVLATSAAFTDTLIRRGIYPDVKGKPPITPGYDLVGTVDKLGGGVMNVEPGQAVAELTITGAYAEYVVLPAKRLTVVPDGLDPAEAVSLILTFVTAYQMLKRIAEVKPKDKVLIHGAGGAVGGALLQIGKLFDLKMYGTASKRQHDFLKEHGCVPIDYREDDFVEYLGRSEPDGVQAVFDAIGGANYKRSPKVLNKRGKLIAFGSYHAQSSLSLAVDFMRIHLWNLLPWLPACAFYSIGAWHKQHHDWFREDLGQLFDWLSAGKIKPTIAKKMQLEQASEAHKAIEKGGITGKIVLLTQTNQPTAD